MRVMQAAFTAPDRDAYFSLKARTETRAFLVSIQKTTLPDQNDRMAT
jgi:hypothetical protein